MMQCKGQIYDLMCVFVDQIKLYASSTVFDNIGESYYNCNALQIQLCHHRKKYIIKYIKI